MDKEQKETIKQLHQFYSDRYKKAVESYLNNYISTEELQLYIDHEKSIPQRINALRKSILDEELLDKTNQILNGTIPADEFIFKLQNDLHILELEYNKLLKTDSITPEDAKQKLDKIKNLENRINCYNKMIDDMKIAKSEIRPKRKVGRPKKKF